jgi:hypothetical protein
MKAFLIILLVFSFACDEDSHSDCFECTITFITTGPGNDQTKESNVFKCDVTEEYIKEMERLAADTITARDGVVVITKAQCNKL